MPDNLTATLPDEWLEEEDIPDTSSQDALAFYLKSLLLGLYSLEDWYIARNFLLIKANVGQAAPDVAFHRGYTNQQQQQERPKSWRIDPPKRPAPPVVFEISSEATWAKDLGEKLYLYGQMGIQEYFAYDPDTPRNWTGRTERLLGWRYQKGQPQALIPDDRGWLWSAELNSWLAPDNQNLKLYDPDGQLRLSEAQAAKAEEAAKETERQRADAIQAEFEAFKAKMRSQNLDPDAL
jgi:Uma2 family endonuclease